MKKIIYLIVFISMISCSNEDNISRDQLVGTWKLGDKTLTFINTNFQYEYNDIFIAGYFTLENNLFEGKAVIKRGTSGGVYPENFSGKITISGDNLIFTDFQDDWKTVFYSSYKKK
ncbi:hypothetical protein OD91_2494 [Lutibacter sp. Hel_I_33_5]|uniref:hypothetical protein n=1 Tax=Lutibacter sp. Hel_I_33_5 TaxID=1566289 RepID=UPI00119E7749|nr:hypothetical protein [Lutibacter sp. Hel_I_33_5]TVZ57186.1 hypothetical protein OD91_2494 [Lutibacter sp. Hel_I_33_5]